MLHQTIETRSRPGPDSKWTAEVRMLFLDHLARKGSVRSACLRVGVSPEIAYRLRRRDPAFARGWAAAIVLARRETEQVLAEQAVEGIVEDVYYRGQWVGSKRRYDARLLLAHLARLDKLAEDPLAEADAERFDEILAVIAGEAIPDELPCEDDVLPLRREDHVAEAERVARIERREVLAGEHETGEDEDDVLLDIDVRREREWAAWEACEAECDAAALEAGFVAGQQWDAWHARVCEAVDRVLAAAPSPLPIHEFGGEPAPEAAAPDEEEPAAEPCRQCQQSDGAELER